MRTYDSDLVHFNILAILTPCPSCSLQPSVLESAEEEEEEEEDEEHT